MVRFIDLSLICVFLVLSCFSGTAQSLRFQHLTIDDGLSQDIVTSIVQDNRGFMWFGTEDGLNCYDGISFTVYKHNPSDSTTLASNFISTLFEDHYGHLWIATNSGTDLFDTQTETFRHVGVLEDGSRISASGFCQSPDSAVWIEAKEGLFRYSDGTFMRAFLDGRPLSHAVWGVRCEEKRIWLIDTAGLHYFSAERESLFSIEIPPALHVLDGLAISQVFRDRRKQLWVCTGFEGIFRFDSTMSQYKHYVVNPQIASELHDGMVRLGIEDREGTLWFGTMSGLERFDPSLDAFAHIQGDLGNPFGFLGDRVYAFHIDRTGIMWIGTYRGGVNIYAAARQKFRPLTSLLHTETHDVYVVNKVSDGTLLAGTESGLYSIVDSPRPSWAPLMKFKGKSVFAIAQLHNGETWVGTNGSIERMRGGSDGHSRIDLPVTDPIRLIFQDADGMLWIGADEHGLYTVDQVGRRVERWLPPEGQYDGGAWSMFQDRTRHLWIGTWNSRYSFRYDKMSRRVWRYGDGPLADVFLAFPSIRVFREDSKGSLWLGTWGGGIYHLDSLYKPIEHLTEVDGLASDYVKSMEIDRKGNLWIGTERGLTMFDPKTTVFKTYTQRDGLQSNFFYSGSSFKSDEGTLFFGGQRGLVAFNPDSIPQNSIPPPVVITQFSVLDKPVPLTEWYSLGKVNLRYDQDFFSFEFVALDFAAPERNRYAYMLDGFDKGWIQAGTRRYAAYTHLDDGSYTFRVKASNNDGIWNEQGTTLRVIVSPAYWQTWWFRLGVATVLALGAYMFYRYRLAKILEVERLRQRIARDLHDDIGTNLSAIVLASQMADREDVPPALHEYVEDMRTVAAETQEHMRDIVWMLNPKNDSLALLVSRMKDEAARLLRELHYSFTSPKDISPKIDLTLKRNIFLIYKEALHNIVKHSDATQVEISIEIQERMFEFQIQDNGRGFDFTRVVAGNGLDNMNARAVQMGAALQIQSSPGGGTKVQLITKIA